MTCKTMEEPPAETPHGLDGQEYLRKHHLAKMFGVSIRTIDRWRAKGHFPYSKLERAVYFEADVVRKVVSSRRAGGSESRSETGTLALTPSPEDLKSRHPK